MPLFTVTFEDTAGSTVDFDVEAAYPEQAIPHARAHARTLAIPVEVGAVLSVVESASALP